MSKSYRQMAAALLTAILVLDHTGGIPYALAELSDDTVTSTIVTATASDADKYVQKATDSNADGEEENSETATPSDAVEEDFLIDDLDRTVTFKSWKWQDPEEILIDGELLLTGDPTGGHNPSFEEVVSMLPEAVEARDAASGSKLTISIHNWTCEDYIQDNDGFWPSEGEYRFLAETEDGYVLAEGESPLEVKVTVLGDIVAPHQTVYLSVASTDRARSVYWDGAKFSGMAYENGYPSAHNYSVEYLGNNTFQLTLNGITSDIRAISVTSGNWIVQLKGVNNLNADDAKETSTGFSVYANSGESSVTFQGDGTLNISGARTDKTNGLDIGSGAVVNINGGTIHVDVTGNFEKNIHVANVRGTLNINNGTLTTKGRWGMNIAGGSVNVNGGQLNVTGEHTWGVHNYGTFNISGGSVNATSTSQDAGGFCILGGSVDVEDGTLETDRIHMENSAGMEIGAGGTVTTGRLTLDDSANMTNDGTLTVNSSCAIGESAKLTNNKHMVLSGTLFAGSAAAFANNGIITGNGTLPDGSKLTAEITRNQERDSKNYADKIDVSFYFTIPGELGTASYEIEENAATTGEGIVDPDTHILKVTKVGDFSIRAKTAANGMYAAAESEPVLLTVEKADINDATFFYPEQSKRSSGYTGFAQKMTGLKIRLDNGVELPETDYQITYKKEGTDEELESMTDAGTYVIAVYGTGNCTGRQKGVQLEYKITPKSLFSSDIKVSITSSNSLVYNGKFQTLDLSVYDETRKTALILGKDYSMSDYMIPYTRGSYFIDIYGVENYAADRRRCTYEVAPADLSKATVTVKGTYIYNGKAQEPSGENIEVKIGNDVIPYNQYRIAYAGDILNAGNEGRVEVYALEDSASPNCTGSASTNFEIHPASLAVSGTTLAPKVYDGTVDAEVESVDWVLGEHTIPLEQGDYEARAEFMDASAGSGKDVTVYVKINDTEHTQNYEKSEYTYILKDQIIQKASAPVLEDSSASYSYNTKGFHSLEIARLPADCGEVSGAVAEVVSDPAGILNSNVTVTGNVVTFELNGNLEENIGKAAEILVTKIGSTNYEDTSARIFIILGEKQEQNGGGSSGGSNNGGGNSNSDGSSSAANQSANNGNITSDPVKGAVSSTNGIVTGVPNSIVNDGYSHWMSDANGWWLRFTDGSYPKAVRNEQTGEIFYGWELINGSWWAFDENGYAGSGWMHDSSYNSWFYLNPDNGLQTGWVCIDGIWYYFNPVSDGTRGAMYHGRKTPDGYYVDETGAWDGKEK